MTEHLCPLACSRCDITCPCSCREVLLEEYDGNGALRFGESVCAHDLTRGVRQ
jgi:hypothetical protein